MIWFGLTALGIFSLWKWTCFFGHKFDLTHRTDEPWVLYFQCSRCHEKHKHCPWDERQ